MSKIKEVILYVPTLSKVLIGFYQKLLEVEPVSNSTSSVSFEFGDSILTIARIKDKGNPVHIAFNVKDINQSFEKHNDWLFFFQEETASFIHYEPWRCISLYFLDPIGNVLEFSEKSEVKFHENSSNAISIGEVGFVTDEVLLNAEKIREATNISNFKRSEGDDTFKALGEDDGLIILNHMFRSWYPYQEINDHATFLEINVEVDNCQYWINIVNDQVQKIEAVTQLLGNET